MADIYREKGCLADAIHQYQILAQHYEDSGEKGKALEIVKIMGEIDLKRSTEAAEGRAGRFPGANRRNL